MGSDAIALYFSKELDSTDCTMRVLERFILTKMDISCVKS